MDRMRPHPPPLAYERAGGSAGAARPAGCAGARSRVARRSIGEASGAAEAFGVRAGMRLGRGALALPLAGAGARRTRSAPRRSGRTRCARLEALGAAVEPARPGEAFFAARAAARALRRSRQAVLAGRGGRSRPPARLGAGPNRLARTRRGEADARPPAGAGRRRAAAARLVAGLPVQRCACRLAHRDAGAASGRASEPGARPSIPTPSSGSACAPWASSRRCPPTRSPTGSASRGCAPCGWRGAPTSRCAPAAHTSRSSVASASPRRPPGPQLERALGAADRAPARPPGARRAGRFAGCGSRPELAAGGGWRSEVALRSASASAERLAAGARPAPRRASRARPPGSACGRSSSGPRPASRRRWRARPPDERRGRLAEAVRQVRAAAGRDALLRVVEVDPRSRVPERRAILTPWSADDG